MNIIEPGHVYQLRILDTDCRFDPNYKPPADLLQQTDHDLLVFVNREEGTEHAGYQTQDVIAALIDRTQHCDACIRWPGNDAIIAHLRAALALHECRAIQRKLEKAEYRPELVGVDNDGHWSLRESQSRTKQAEVARAVQQGRLAAMPPARDIDDVYKALQDGREVSVQSDENGYRKVCIQAEVKSGREDTNE